MPQTFIGLGQCGCAIIDAIFAEKDMFQLAYPIAINSNVNDFKKLKNLKNRQYWIGISRDKGFIEGTTPGLGEHLKSGFGNNPEIAEEIIAPKYDEFKGFLKNRIEKHPAGGKIKEEISTPFALLAVGTGGGTGSGTAPYVAHALKELYANISIIAIAVLPQHKGSSHFALNSWKCIQKLSKHVDGFILVDNERLSHKESIEFYFPKYNRYIARCITDLITQTTTEKIELSRFGEGFKEIDFMDIVTTISFQSGGKNKPGFAAIGRASRQARNLAFYMPVISRLPMGYSSINFKEILGEAMESLSLKIEDYELKNAKKNLVNLRVPDYYLKKEGLLNTGDIKKYIEEHTEIRSMFGGSQTKRNLISTTVLFTFLPYELNRLLGIEKTAIDYANKEGIVVRDYEFSQTF